MQSARSRSPSVTRNPLRIEHDGDQPVGGVVEPVEIGRVFELGHDLLGQCPGQQLGAVRVVLVVEGDRGGEAGVPVVLADRGEQPVERADVAAAAFDAQLAQVGEVVLEQRPVELIDAFDTGAGTGTPRTG